MGGPDADGRGAVASARPADGPPPRTRGHVPVRVALMNPMHTLDPSFNPDVFFARERAETSRVLMLDYDGTLAPFHVNPKEAVPYNGIVPLLNEIQDAGHTRLEIVSGLWTKDLIPLLKLKQMPEIWGSHGWERLEPQGQYEG